MSGYLLSKGDSFLGVLGWFWIGCVIDFVSKGFVGVFGFAKRYRDSTTNRHIPYRYFYSIPQ